MPSIDLIKAVAVTAELCGRAFSQEAAAVFVQDLSAYPEEAVLRALHKCRREVKGLLTTQDVVSRIDDGRPGPEEAWAMLPLEEWQSVVWTDEMREAYGACAPLLAEDRIAARMAFKEAYQRLVGAARDSGKRVTWVPSLGHDSQHRARVIQEAVEMGRLTHEAASEACPQITGPAVLAIEGPKAEAVKQEVRKFAAAIAELDPLQWAKDLRTKERGGLPLTETQRLAWRKALDVAQAQDGPPMKFEPIPQEALPPGMRRQA